MSYLALILGMVAVTYLPRMAPLTLLDGARLPRWVRRFLTALPAAALGALLIPGTVTAVPDLPWVGIVAVAVAAATSLTRGGMIVGVLAGVLTAFGLLLVL